MLVRSVMILYGGAKKRVRVNFDFSEKFTDKVEMQQGLYFHLLFLQLWQMLLN